MSVRTSKRVKALPLIVLAAVGALLWLTPAHAAQDLSALRSTAYHTPLDRPLSEIEIRTFASQVIALVNQERDNHGILPLAEHPSLDAAAQGHSDDMAANDFISHTGSDGSSLSQRVRRAGYNGVWIGENIAGGQSSPSQAVSAWMSSPPHRANILTPGYQHAGVGYAYNEDATYRHYWTLDFGATTYNPLPTATQTSTGAPTRTSTPRSTSTRPPSFTPEPTWAPTLTRTPSLPPTATPTWTVQVAKNSYRFNVWVKTAGDESGIRAVPVRLYRWRSGMWILLSERKTNKNGWLAFTCSGPDARFALVSGTRDGYTSA